MADDNYGPLMVFKELRNNKLIGINPKKTTADKDS